MKVKDVVSKVGEVLAPVFGGREGRGRSASQDEYGRELVDSVPMQPPAGISRVQSQAEMIRDIVRSQLLQQAADAVGVETFADADDFDVGEFDMTSPYEEQFDPFAGLEDEIARESESDARSSRQGPPKAASETLDDDGTGSNPPASPSPPGEGDAPPARGSRPKGRQAP